MPVSKVKKQGWCDEERKRREEKGKKEGFCVHPHKGHFAHEHICYRASDSLLKQCQPD